MQNKQITIAIGKSRTSKKWKNTKLTWGELGERLQEVTKTHETAAEYSKMKKADQAPLKDVGGFVGGHLRDGRRKETNVEARTIITLDADFAAKDFISSLELFFDYEAYIYSTHSHTPSKPRYRLILPLDREVNSEEYEAIARKIASDIAIDEFDDTTYQASRLMYWASTPKDVEFEFYHLEGSIVNADEVLATYRDWRDMSEWAESSRSQGLHKSLAKKQGDPLEKVGVIGAFCRTYTIEEAIETFLTDVYEKCETPNRYTFLEGSTAAGLVVYDDRFAYSNHGTDPAGQKLSNAFDLVRIHKYGSLDENSKEDTPVNKLPSFKAMQEFITSDRKSKETLLTERFAEVESEFDVVQEDKDWFLDLELDTKGNVKSTIQNIILILENDPDIKDGIIGWDLLEDRDRIVKDKLPWTATSNYWSDKDDASLRLFMESKYKIIGNGKLRDGVDIVFREKSFHPVRDYLQSLEWDGEERLESIFIKYLGAEDTAYNRKVTRMHLCAAVARAMRPGIKYDNQLVFIGKQGLGKSNIIYLLSNGWHTDSITKVTGKEAYEALDGAWLCEMPEMSASKKSDVDDVKHFLAKREDRYRKAYGRRNDVSPRQCIFFGSTNRHDFLKDTTGNRRFLPMDVGVTSNRYKLNELEQSYIDQMWAEAFVYWQRKEPLYLEAEVEQEAMKQQEEHREEDPWASAIEKFVLRKVPIDWKEYSLEQRTSFLNDEFTAEVPKDNLVHRDRVCVQEIWRELFEETDKRITRFDANRITGVLESLPYCERSKSNLIYGSYLGRQKGFSVNIKDTNI